MQQEMTILSGEDIRKLTMRSVGDYCDNHKLGYIGPECPSCAVEMVAQSTLSDELDLRREVK